MEAKETYYDWSSWQQESRVRREIKRPSIEERDNAPRARYDELAARPSRRSLKRGDENLILPRGNRRLSAEALQPAKDEHAASPWNTGVCWMRGVS